MSKIKLLVMDIDRTIITEDAYLPPPVKEAIHKVSKAGIPVVLASGRGSNGVYQFKEILELPEAYCFADNGATVFTTMDDVTVTKFIPDEDTYAIIDALKKKNMEITVTAVGGLYFEEMTPYMRKFMERFNADMKQNKVEDLRSVKNVFKICICPRNAEESAFPETLLTENTELCRGYREFCDFTPKGINKGVALQVILDKLGIDKSEIAAVGDAQNDVPMIQGAGLACAVDNAEDALKAAANLILPSCDDMGVKYLIDNYILGDKTI